MAAGIVYLDVDDEITSAAARIRSSATPRVALVVPYGSRIATSRMNFRLLSREAIVSNRRLSIVSGDAASRALAASAGLPVFATVGEYEDAQGRHDGDGESPAPPAGDASRQLARAVADAGSLAASETVAAVGPAPFESRVAATAGVPDATLVMPAPARGRAAPAPRPDPGSAPAARRPSVTDDAAATQPIEADRRDLGRTRSRTAVFIGLALLGLALVVAGVGAYLFLPAATIAVTPRQEPISVSLTVTADPDATAVDPGAGTVPAVRLDVPVQAGQTFTTTGKQVQETAATGSVTFTNYDPTSSDTILKGSIVSTEGGIRFRTLATITVSRASFTPPSTTVPSNASVAISAVKPGTAGNVPANAIRVVPQGKNPLFLAVANPSDLTGGTHTETPQVSQTDVDKAVASLQTQLATAFADAVANGAGAPAGTTTFPKTAVLGSPTPSVDPATLVGQPVATFDLSLSASGTVIAVDPTPVRTLAEAQLKAKVGTDHRLVDGSVVVDVGDGTVDDTGAVRFDATARASRVLLVDPASLRSLVKGKTVADATAALAKFGDVQVSLWPSWATTVTSVDARLSVVVNDATQTAPSSSPASAPSRASSVAPSRRPSPSPTGAEGSGAPSSAP
jgi:hypothetical protein